MIMELSSHPNVVNEPGERAKALGVSGQLSLAVLGDGDEHFVG
jgi:hypothetical protein